VIDCWCMLFVGDGVKSHLSRAIREHVGIREKTREVWKLIITNGHISR
jgi:hypothetical protein